MRGEGEGDRGASERSGGRKKYYFENRCVTYTLPPLHRITQSKNKTKTAWERTAKLNIGTRLEEGRRRGRAGVGWGGVGWDG